MKNVILSQYLTVNRKLIYATQKLIIQQSLTLFEKSTKNIFLETKLKQNLQASDFLLKYEASFKS